MWRYKELIPIPSNTPIVSLCEGGTPLVKLVRLEDASHGLNVYLKFEGANPTGSFKDRGMSVGVSVARFFKVKAVICASTGNTAASMTAYAARAGLKSIVLLPRGRVARGKLLQTILHGATLLFVESFDKALELVLEAIDRHAIYTLNSINPWRVEGQKTVAFEIADEIGVPDWIIVPVGNGGNISAIWKGFRELVEAGLVEKLPRLVGVQASGAAPLARAFREDLEKPEFVEEPETIASAIRIGKPINWPRALNAVRESGGLIVDVDDEEILEAQKKLGRFEGLDVESASAASLAGLTKLRGEGVIGGDETVVLIGTGHALKEPEILNYYSMNTRTSSGEDILDIIGAITAGKTSI